MSYATFGSNELGQDDRSQQEEQEGSWCHLFQTVIFIGSAYMLMFVCTNFTIFAADRLRSDIPGMTKVALGTCQSLFWIGWMVASGLIMPNVDAWGRKRPTFFFLFLSLFVAVFITFATTVWSFGTGLFLLGLLFPPSALTAAIWMQESVPASQRSTIIVLANVGYAAGSALMAVTCMYTKHWSWRDEARLWFAPLLVLMVVGPFVTREPAKAASDQAEDNQNTVSFTAQIHALFFSPLRQNTLATLVCWTACAFTFYGLNYSAGNISDDLYSNMALLGLVDIVGYFVPLPIMQSLGKLDAQTLGFCGASAALIIGCFAQRGSMAAIGFALVGRLFINLAFTTIYVLVVDCFPEERRASAMGMANLFGRLGSTAAPYTSLLPFHVTSLILSAFTCTAAMATRCLTVDVSKSVK